MCSYKVPALTTCEAYPLGVNSAALYFVCEVRVRELHPAEEHAVTEPVFNGACRVEIAVFSEVCRSGGQYRHSWDCFLYFSYTLDHPVDSLKRMLIWRVFPCIEGACDMCCCIGVPHREIDHVESEGLEILYKSHWLCQILFHCAGFLPESCVFRVAVIDTDPCSDHE